MMTQDNTSPCPPVWQYILIMCAEITALMKGLMRIGLYHYAQTDAAKMAEIATTLDRITGEIRELVEDLTGWRQPAS